MPTPAEEVLLTIVELSEPSRFDSRIARTAALVKRLSFANESSLRELLAQSRNLQAGSWQAEVQDSIIQRLAVLDPIDALAHVNEFPESRQQSLIPIVYGEWAVSNLQQAVDNARELGDDLKPIVVQSVVLSRTDLPTAQLRKIARNLGHESIAIKLIREQSELEAIKNPEKELKSLLNSSARSLDDLNETQSELFRQLAVAWVLQDGVDVYEEIEKSVPMSHIQQQGLLFSIGRNLAENSPELAFQLGVKAGSVGFGGLADFTVRTWANSDPVTALSAVGALEGPSARQMLQSRVMESWAAKDPDELLDASQSMPADLKTMALEKALVVMAQSSPRSALRLLGDIANKDVRDRIAEGIATGWARLDIDDALQWIDNDRTLSAKDDLRNAAIASLVTANPQLAIAAALSLPPDEFGRGPEANAIRYLVHHDVDMAIQLLPLARDNKTKSDAYDSVMNSLLYRHNDFQQALDLFLQLVEDVGTPEKGLWTLAWNRPMELFQSLDELPSDELKKEAARDLLYNHESSGTFTDEQLDYLRKLDTTPRVRRTPEMEAALEKLLEAMD